MLIFHPQDHTCFSHIKNMKILYTSPFMEYPAAGGPELRIENSIKALSQISELDIINRDPNSTKTTNEFYRKYSGEYHVLIRGIPESFLGKLFFFAEKVINRIFGTRNYAQAKFLLRHVDRRQIDVLWFGFGNISYSLIKRVRKMRPELMIVCDTDSVWSRFILRELPHAKSLRKCRILLLGIKKRIEESSLVNYSNVITAVSEVDARYYRSLTSDVNKVQIFSNVIDTNNYALQSTLSRPHPPAILLAGSFGHQNSPLDVAARWFLDYVFPIILNEYPTIHFYIVGRNSEKNFGYLTSKNITVTGRVESVIPYLSKASISIVPLKFESGTRFKILEAGASGVPVVSTALGAEGLAVSDRVHLLIANDSKSFAGAISEILNNQDLSHKLINNCKELVKERYSVDSLVIEAKVILGYLNNA